MDESAKKISNSVPAGISECGRQSAKGVLITKIERRESEVNALRVLMNCIDWDTLSKEDEELLWRYFVRRD